MTALGFYLLVSLMFVMATMAEFAVVLFLERRLDLNREIKVNAKQNSTGLESINLKLITARIDLAASVLFIAGYIVFNLVYWSYYMRLPQLVTQ